MTPRISAPWRQRLLVTSAAWAALWLLGWLVLPLALKPLLQSQASTALGRQVTVEGVGFKPWTLELEVRGLRVATADGQGSQLSVQRLGVNAELVSLLRLAPVLDAVQVEHPVLNLTHLADGRLDVQDILDALSPPDAPPPPDTGPPRMALHNIELTDGEITLNDAPRQQVHQLSGLNLAIPFIHTLGNAQAVREVRVQPKLSFQLNGSRFETDAITQPFGDSLSTQAQLRMVGLDLTPYLPYLPPHLPVRPTKATLGADLTLNFEQTPNPSLHITGTVSAHGVAVNDGSGQPLLTLADAQLTLADVRPWQRVALLSDVTLTDPALTLSRNAQGQLNVATQAPRKTAASSETTADSKAQSIAYNAYPSSATAQKGLKTKSTAPPKDTEWELGIAQLTLNGGRVDWRDGAAATPAHLTLSQLTIQARQLHLPLPTDAQLAASLDLTAQLGDGRRSAQADNDQTRTAKAGTAPTSAQLNIKATALATEAQATLNLQNLGLELLAPYLKAHLQPSLSGQLGLQAQLNWKPATQAGQPDDLTLALTQAKLSALRLLDGTTELASLQGLDIANASLSLREHSADLGRITLTRPHLPVQRAANGQLMFSQWLVADSATAPTAEPASAATAATAPTPRRTGGANQAAGADGANATDAAPSAPLASPAATPAWRWQLPELSVVDGQLSWRDALPAQPVALQASSVQLKLQGLASGNSPPATLTTSLRLAAGTTEPGSLSWRGTVALGANDQSPQVSGQLDARRLPAHALAPYAADQLSLTLLRADTSFLGSVALQTSPAGPRVQLAGDVTLEDFRAHTAATAPAPTEELLHWKTLNLKGLDLKLAPATATRISIASGALSDFFARIVIQENGRINLQDISKQAAAEAAQTPTTTTATAPGTTAAAAKTAASPTTTTSPSATHSGTTTPDGPVTQAAAAPANATDLPPVIRIGPFSLVHGEVDFADHFIRPNYQAKLSELTGRLGGFSSQVGTTADGTPAPPEMAELELRGRAEGTASLEITGQVNPLAKTLALNIQGKVRDLELPPLSPYTIKYTGHGIERGKLSLDVTYSVLPSGQLTARNQLVLHQLTFGDAVPGAPASLPVRLATALLADRQGVIDLDLPIQGSLNDPQFSLVPVIFKIIGNVIVKAITAPFSLLANALGGSAEEMNQVAFAPGTAQLLPAAQTTLTRLAQALNDRPALTLTVTGHAHLDAERTAYQEAKLQAQVRAQTGATVPAEQARGQAPAASQAPDPAATTEANARGLLALYQRTDMPKPRNALGLAKDISPEDMKALLLAQIPATDTAMHALAVQRGVAVRDELVRQGVPSQRLFLASPVTQAPPAGSPWQPHAAMALALP